ncbi:MAG: hypothetical protein ABII71_04715 [Candidatus Micrarchaeota archaeon]
MEDMKELEKKVYLSMFDDGLWDIYFGMMLLGMGIGSYVRNIFESLGLPEMIVSFLFPGLAIVVLVAGKALIVRPRIGLVKFSPERMRKMAFAKLALSILIVVSIVATAGLWYLGSSGFHPSQGSIEDLFLGPLMISLIVFIPLVLIGFFLKFERMYVIATLFGLSMFLGESARAFGAGELPGDVGMSIAGLAVLLFGVQYLLKFLEKYPIIRGEKHGHE